MKIVSPYKPIAPAHSNHFALRDAGFNWIDALKMLAHSSRVRAGIQTVAITDSPLPVPHYRYDIGEKRLMFWLLKVCIKYLESSHFDQDTLCCFPDNLIHDDVDLFGDFDIGFSMRTKPSQVVPLLNGVQWWAHGSRVKLVRLYRECLNIAETLDEREKKWGADTTPLLMLLGPVEEGTFDRGGIRVRYFPAGTVRTITETTLRKGKVNTRVADFKGMAKLRMKRWFEIQYATDTRMGIP